MRKKAKKIVDNILETAGYIGLLLQACWAVLIYVAWTVQSGILQKYLDAMGTNAPSTSSWDIQLPDFVRIPLIVIVVLCVIVMAIYFIRTTPETATKMTISVTEKAAHSAEPVLKKVVHTPKLRKRVTPKITLFITKMSTSLVLFALAFAGQSLVSLDYGIASIISVTTALFSITMIVSEFAVAHIWHLSSKARS